MKISGFRCNWSGVTKIGGVRGRVGCVVGSRLSYQTQGRPELGFLTEWGRRGVSAVSDVGRWGKHKTTDNNHEGPVGMVNTNTFQETEKSDQKITLLKKNWQDALQKRKYSSVQALFTFSMSYICFVFLRFLSASQSPIFSFWTEDMIWKLSGTLVVNDLLEGAGRFTVIKWLVTAEGSLRYFCGGKKPKIDFK